MKTRFLLPIFVSGLLTSSIIGFPCCAASPPALEFVRVSADKRGFLLEKSGKPFIPWGFNYDHDETGRLIEDYWEDEWPKVEEDFAEMKRLGANVVRIHIQFGKFMDAADKPNEKSLEKLGKLLTLAEKERIYIDLTGLGCYHKKDVPAWYDALDEAGRWNAQAAFWQAVAKQCAASPAIFCYDLMNEPANERMTTGLARRLGTSTSCSAFRSTRRIVRGPKLLRPGLRN